jgi:type II secretion system (T2SS) protein E
METRLGQMLVKAKLITPAQLEMALNNQVILGGRLGTNLLELGYLSEKELARFLSRKVGVQAASAEELDEIQPEVIRLIPEQVAEKYKVLPLRVEQKRLTVVMADPLDYAAIEELSFITGFIIVALVSPEARLTHALKRYYGIKPEKRYIAVTEAVRRQAWKEREEEHGSEPPAVAATDLGEALETAIELPPLGEFEGFHKGAEEADYQIPRQPRLRSEEVGDPSAALADATSRDTIAETVVRYVGAHFAHAALFLLKGESAQGWYAMTQKTMLGGFSRANLTLDEPSLMKQVVDTRRFYLGPPVAYNADEQLQALLGSARPEGILLMPIILMNRVVALLYADDSLARLSRGLGDLQKLAAKSAFAFEILILKNKILNL